jgi:hypothetical protein
MMKTDKKQMTQNTRDYPLNQENKNMRPSDPENTKKGKIKKSKKRRF